MGMRSRSREGRRGDYGRDGKGSWSRHGQDGDRHEDAQRSDRGDASRWADRSRSREGRNYDSSWQRRSDGANDDQRGSATKRSRSHRGHDYNSWRDRNNLGRDEHRGPGPQGHGRSRSGHGSFADQRVANLVVPCVWLGGCHEDITEREIEKVCSMFGPVEGVTIKRSSRDTFAFVEYAEMSQARDAILELDQTAPFGSGVIKAAPANKKPSDNHRDNDRDQRDQHANSKDWNWGKQGYYSRDSHNGWHDRSWPNGGSRGYGRDTHDGQDTRDDRVGRDGRDTRDDRGGRDGRDGRNDRGDRVGRDARDDRGGRGGRDVCEERAGRHDRGGYERERERSLPHRDPSLERPPQKERRMRVMLSQLPRDMEEDELTEIAAEYGNVLEYELHREGAYKCGWVEYATKKEAEAAVGALNDRRMDEWHMRLQAYAYPGGGH